MTQMPCGYAGDRDETLIAYLYDDIDPAARAEFDTHLATCEQCRIELQALGGVRSTLARWNPPELKSLVAGSPPAVRRSWWREIPAWAQVAAALLFLGVSAGIANLDIRYDSNGLAIRTGWSTPPSPRAQSTGATAPIGAASQSNVNAASMADLTALAAALRAEFRSQRATLTPGAPSPRTFAPMARSGAGDTEILRKVRVLIGETERRQERELALRLAQAIGEINAARQADLRRVDLSLNRVENNLGVEVLKNKQSMQYLMRVSQRQ